MDSFANEIIAYSRYWPKNKINCEHKNAFILMSSPSISSVHLELCLRNILAFNNNEWRVIIIVPSSKYAVTLQISEFLDKSIEVYVSNEYFSNQNLDLNHFHSHIGSKEFMDLYRIKKFCLLHPDCLILNKRFSEFINKNHLINNYSSKHLPMKYETVGNGGLIVRSYNYLDFLEDDHCLKRNIYKFMTIHHLNDLPDFYRFEKFIDETLYQYHTTTTFIDDPYWVHCPENLGDDWQNYLKSYLTPYFNIRGLPRLAKFSYNSESESNTITLVPNNFNGNLDVSLVEVNYDDEKILSADLIRLNRCEQNLKLLMDKYKIIGDPYKILNVKTDSAKSKIYFYNKQKQPPNKSTSRKIVLFLKRPNDILEYTYCNPLLIVLPYRASSKDLLTNRVRINDWTYYGHFITPQEEKINCLLIPPFLKRKFTDIQQNRLVDPLYIKQTQSQIDDGLIPEAICELIIQGHPIFTNNLDVFKYYNIEPRDIECSQQQWISFFNNVKRTKTIEHSVVLILNIVDHILSSGNLVSSKNLDSNENLVPRENDVSNLLSPITHLDHSKNEFVRRKSLSHKRLLTRRTICSVGQGPMIPELALQNSPTLTANYRFGGFNNKITPYLVMPRKKVSIVSMEKYSTINRAKL